MSSVHDDPRDSSLETKLTLPTTWETGGADGLSASSMFIAGAVMVTRNRFFAWPAVVFGFSSYINSHPLRTKDGGSAWTGILMSLGAVLTGYMPLVVISKLPTQTPLPIN